MTQRTSAAALFLLFLASTTPSSGQGLNLPKLEADIQAAVEKAMPAVVACGIKGRPGSFSAVIVSEDGLVLTAAHCVARRGPQIRIRPGNKPPAGKPTPTPKPKVPLKKDENKQKNEDQKADPKDEKKKPAKETPKADAKKKKETIYILTLPDGRKAEAVALGYNQTLDCAMMQITDKETKWPFAEMGDSSQVVTNQPCLAISHPGSGSKGRGPVVRFGRIKQPVTIRAGMLQSTCLIEPGDSGGPLFDMDGQVIGINSQIDMSFNRNFQVAVNTFREYWKPMQEKGAFKHSGTPGIPKHGISWRSSRSKGLSVTKIAKDSIAGAAGLKKGDRVAKINDRRVMSSRQFETQYIKIYQAGETNVKLTLREGEKDEETTRDVTLTLPEQPEPTGVAMPELEHLPSHVAELEEKLDDAVVVISSQLNGKYMSVYGTVASDDGLIVSKSSQVGDADIVVKLPNGDRPEAEVVARDDKNDLVLIRCEAVAGRPPLTMSPPESEDKNNLSFGKMLMTPNPRGEAYVSVVGTKTFESEAPAGSSSSYLGIAMRERKNQPVITAVNRNSEAGLAGLRAGDIIVSLNGKKVRKVKEVQDFLRKLKPGAGFFIELERRGSAIAKRVKVGRRPERKGHAADFLVGGKSQRRNGFSSIFTHDGRFEQKEVGTPVFDLDGNFVAFNIARHSRAQCYAIPAPIVAKFVAENMK